MVFVANGDGFTGCVDRVKLEDWKLAAETVVEYGRVSRLEEVSSGAKDRMRADGLIAMCMQLNGMTETRTESD